MSRKTINFITIFFYISLIIIIFDQLNGAESLDCDSNEYECMIRYDRNRFSSQD